MHASFSEHIRTLFHCHDVLTLLHCQDSLTECFCHWYSFFMFGRSQFQILTWMSGIVTEVFVVSAYIGSQHLLAHTQQLVIHYHFVMTRVIVSHRCHFCNDPGVREPPESLMGWPWRVGRGRCHDKVDNAATNQEILVLNEPGVVRGQ